MGQAPPLPRLMYGRRRPLASLRRTQALPARRPSLSAVVGSAGKKASSASSESVISRGVPNTVVVLKNDNTPPSLTRRKGITTPPKSPLPSGGRPPLAGAG